MESSPSSGEGAVPRILETNLPNRLGSSLAENPNLSLKIYATVNALTPNSVIADGFILLAINYKLHAQIYKDYSMYG